MIGYPNGKKNDEQKNGIPHGKRGMSLEKDLNDTNAYYLQANKAAIYKKPTPINIVNVDYKSRSTAKITEAYFQTPSTTDYNGVYRGKYIDFEAKETHSQTSLALSMIHEHQFKHLRNVINFGGIAFLIVRFDLNAYEETYVVMAQDLFKQIDNSSAKSIKYSWFKENAYLVPYNYTVKVDYLKVIDQFIDGGNDE